MRPVKTGMYTIKVIGQFSSAHNLRGYQGKCEAVHGHNWKVEASLSGGALDRTGMVMDFKHLKAELNAVLETLDHAYLNDIPYFKKVNPTSENIAKYIFDCLGRSLKRSVLLVTVWENDTSCATYAR